MTGLPMDVPQRDGVRLGCVIKERHAGDTLCHLALGGGGGTQATEVTFDISRKYRHARITEGFGQALQRDRLAGARGAGDQPVTVGQAHGLGNGLAVKTGPDKELRGVRHFVTHG
jgi:hypothetical protein